MNNKQLFWPRDSICIQISSLDVKSVAADIYYRTCRVNFDAPGFCILNVGHNIDSVAFRQLMVDLKREMAVIHESITGNTLMYQSVGRFDQQETTRPHLDGGPDESFLMLGYEPSEVDSELEIYDYTKCAFDYELSPKEFLAKYNPMFESGYEVLQPYSTCLPCFSTTGYQIVCINNSCSPYSESQPAWQGTLHTATILSPNESERRVINSTMIASVPVDTMEAVDDSELNDFISTSVIRHGGYGT